MKIKVAAFTVSEKPSNTVFEKNRISVQIFIRILTEGVHVWHNVCLYRVDYNERFG